jgi:hypothetical protein
MILSKEATMFFQWPIFNNVKKEPSETTSPQAHSNLTIHKRATIPMSRPPKPFDFIPTVDKQSTTTSYSINISLK